MATFYLIRHGKPDYTYGDTHGFIGQGHDFAPLKQDRLKEVIETSKDVRLKNAQIIVASPYTRASYTNQRAPDRTAPIYKTLTHSYNNIKRNRARNCG